jgi:hypothetical protein
MQHNGVTLITTPWFDEDKRSIQFVMIMSTNGVNPFGN